MRHLILMRGAPGSGKSTFIRQHGLSALTISPDDFRLRLGGISMTPDGDLQVNHANEKRVWNEVEEVLDFKMAQGQTVVFDATFQRTRDFSLAIKLADRHRYQLHCVDFTGVPKKTALAQNQMREPWKVVPDQVIETAYARFVEHRVPEKINVWSFDEFTEDSPLDRIEPPMLDLSDYAGVVHIGDLQGCYEPVKELFADGWRDDHFYIFVGDLLDRGIQNGECIRFAVDEILPRENAALIFGNHEYHIHRFAKGLHPVSREFQFNTLPQIEQAGFDKKQANALMDKSLDAMRYVYRGQKVLVTHAGLSRVPDRLAILPSQTYWKGTGGYEHPVDQTFSDQSEGWWQVHGHRNKQELPVEAAPGSFNLEREVEFGGFMRVMTLIGQKDAVKVETREIKNDVFRSKADLKKRDKISPRDAGEHGKISAEMMGKFDAHPLVRAKTFASRPHLSSLNFTREAFFDGKWDDVNGMARGLFVADDRRIVARSYPKFFNLEERAETQTRNLANRLQFPLKLWVKENGFLGILGWDHIDDEAFFASKSTPESDFAGWFREIITAEAGVEGIKKASAVVKNRNVTLVFEANDPVRDPHMIEYEDAHVVLLDAILRTEAFEKLPYSELVQIASTIGVAVKQPGPTFQNWKDFAGWLKSVESQGRYFQWKDTHIEGFVCEDAAGFQFKIKLDFYAFWKRMRTVRDRVRRAREKGQPPPVLRENDETASAFQEWMTTQPDSAFAESIIDLRKRFEAGA